MISTRNLLNKQNLLSLISTYQIFSTYCRNFEQIGKAFKSEFRDEKSPSCMIEMIGGDLLYTDFGKGSYRAIEFVMRKFNLDFKDALRKINLDFSLNLIDSSKSDFHYIRTNVVMSELKQKLAQKKTTKIDVKYSDYTQEDIDYWNKYGWTEDMLKMASIKPIDFYWLTIEHKNIIQAPYQVINELAYSYDYYWHNGIFRRKLYFPEREGKFKWLSNVDNTIIQNWDLLPKNGGDTLFITSSKKDCGGYYRLYNQWNACAPNNEGSFLPERVFLSKIRPRWKRIIIWFDNDETGVKNALKYAQKYNIEAVWNPLRCPYKDQSDLIAADGLREFNYQLQKLI